MPFLFFWSFAKAPGARSDRSKDCRLQRSISSSHIGLAVRRQVIGCSRQPHQDGCSRYVCLLSPSWTDYLTNVSALFRWLSKKYPKIISPVIEDQPTNVDGQEVPVDTTKANPNGEEFDNLYLDMNGIVHPCSHPEDRPPPANEEEMMLAIFNYTDRVVNMVRPRKLLMIAVGMSETKRIQDVQASWPLRTAAIF